VQNFLNKTGQQRRTEQAVIVSFTLEREEKIKYSGETFIFLLIIYLNDIKNSWRLKKRNKEVR